MILRGRGSLPRENIRPAAACGGVKRRGASRAFGVRQGDGEVPLFGLVEGDRRKPGEVGRRGVVFGRMVVEFTF
jgi:hypothetical protein